MGATSMGAGEMSHALISVYDDKFSCRIDRSIEINKQKEDSHKTILTLPTTSRHLNHPRIRVHHKCQ